MIKEIPLLLFKNCDESVKGIKCKDIVEETCNKFFSLTIDEVELALNEKRQFLVSQWAYKGLHNKIIYKNKEIGFTYDKGLCELAKDFKLYHPKIIEVSINKGMRKNDHPADVNFSILESKFDHVHCSFRFEKVRLVIFLDLLDYGKDNENETLVWPNRDPYYFTDILYHELLHICGDIICDGIIRHNLVGIDVISELMKQT
jgi:hypothetical protein